MLQKQIRRKAGGLTSLLILLKNSQDETTQTVAASAIANLAMNGKLPCHVLSY